MKGFIDLSQFKEVRLGKKAHAVEAGFTLDDCGSSAVVLSEECLTQQNLEDAEKKWFMSLPEEIQTNTRFLGF